MNDEIINSLNIITRINSMVVNALINLRCANSRSKPNTASRFSRHTRQSHRNVINPPIEKIK